MGSRPRKTSRKVKKCEQCSKDIVGRRSHSKYCSSVCQKKARGAVWRATKGRDVYLRREYGISEEQYNKLLEEQDHCCAVCGRNKTEFNKHLNVDHNHTTGEIRGLLCTNCNHRLIGKHTDGSLLRKMAEYVEQGTGWFVPEGKKTRKRRRKKRTKND